MTSRYYPDPDLFHDDEVIRCPACLCVACCCAYVPEEPAMLVLTRRKGESIVLELPDGRKVEIGVNWIRGDKVSVGIEAPQDVVIVRKELEGQS